MSREFHMPFVPREIEMLQPGEVSLGVPLRDDVIQIGDFSDLPRGGIIVTKSLDAVTTIARTEPDSRLQAEVVYKEGALPGSGAQRAPVFGEPIDMLRVYARMTTNGNRLWVAAADHLSIVDDIDLEKFCLTVGNYAMIKYGRQRQHS